MKPPKDNEVREQDYFFSSGKWPLRLAIFACFIVAFIFNFPTKTLFKNLIEKRLATVISCPIRYDSVDIGLFFPKIIFRQLNIPRECLRGQQELKLKEANLIFRGFSIYPLGPKIVITGKMAKSNFSLSIIQAWGQRVIALNETKINIKEMAETFSSSKILGEVEIEGNITIDKQNNIIDLNTQIISKDLEIPSQKVMGFDTPSLPLQQFTFRAELDKKNIINVTELKVGTVKSPVTGQFKGSIRYTPQSPARSELDLQGQLGLSKDFQEKFPILPKIILKRFDKIDGFYQMKLRGSLSEPMPTPI